MKQTYKQEIKYSIQQIGFGFGIAFILGSCFLLGFGTLLVVKAATNASQDLNNFEDSRITSLASDIVLEDIFERRINDTGITLVDWEGYIANPAIKIFIKPPENINYPQSALLAANGTRLYFDTPSEAGADGPTKPVTFTSTSDKIPIYVSIFPDRDSIDEDYTLTIQFENAWGKQTSTTVNIHVIDQDKNQSLLFKVTNDFSQDQTGFFDDPHKKDIVQQATDDWAYFFDDMKLESVPIGTESTWIVQPDGEWANRPITNAITYTDYLLYPMGIDTTKSHIGIGFAEGSFHTNYDSSTIRRSGGIGIETGEKHKALDWFLTENDEDWWQASGCSCGPYDLYSVVIHEIGYALVFHPNHTLFGRAEKKGYLEDPAVRAYQGFYPKIDSISHFSEGGIDRISQRGALGYETHTKMADGRWLITKLDLLAAQAIGYKLRPTSPFIPLSVQTSDLPAGVYLKAYTVTLQANGGIPAYHWEIVSGTLPPGLFLDSFSGTITGIPNQIGTFGFTVRVRDYDSNNPGILIPLSLTITGS